MDALAVYAVTYLAYMRVAGDACCSPDGEPRRFGLTETPSHTLLPPWLVATLVAWGYASARRRGGVVPALRQLLGDQ